MLRLEVTAAIRQLLARISLTGAEVEAYNHIMRALAVNDAEAQSAARKTETRKYETPSTDDSPTSLPN